MFRNLFLLSLIAAVLGKATAQIPVASWPLVGGVDSSQSVTPIDLSAQTAAGAARISNHLVPTSAQDRLQAGGWPVGALDERCYVEFSLRGAGGWSVKYSAFQFKVTAPQPGACDWEVRSSVDGFSAAVASGSVTDLTPAGPVSSAPLASLLGTRPELVRLRLYLFNNSGGTAPTVRGLLGTAAGGLDPTIIAATIANTGAELVHWALQGAIDSNVPLAPAAIAFGVDAGPMSKAPQLQAVTSIAEFEASGFTAPTFSANQYIELSIAPEYGRGITFSRFVFSIEASTALFNYGGNWALRSSVDGFAANVASGNFGPFGGPSDVIADISSLGFTTEPVTLRLHYYGNFGASPTRRGFQQWFGPGVHNGDGPKILGVVSNLGADYPGTFDDLATNVGTSAFFLRRVAKALDVAPGELVTIEHVTPTGTLAFDGEFIVLASTRPTGQAFSQVFPGVWMEPTTLVTVLDQDAFGFPLLLPPQGLRWSFAYQGGLAGTSVLLQAHVITSSARNGLLASTDGLELNFQ